MLAELPRGLQPPPHHQRPDIHISVQMSVDEETMKAPIILTIGPNDEEHALVRDGWTNFDAAACECFDQNDKKLIFAVVEHHPGGAEAFNRHVRGLAIELLAASHALLAQPQPAWCFICVYIYIHTIYIIYTM